MSSEFTKAKSKLAALKSNIDNHTKLKLYALFKQVTSGKCNTPMPGITDFVGRAKWKAWNNLKEMSKLNAETSYINLVTELYNKEHPEMEQNTKNKLLISKYKEIVTWIEFGNIFMIKFNRPKKYNALNEQMYNEVALALKEADQDSNVIACCFTGEGEYFSSGNDLNNYTGPTVSAEDIETTIKRGCDVCGNFVRSFINFSKPLIALVNGPAVGIAFTILGLFDLVISNNKATFSAPFTKIALSPEGCSSYIFPMLMGRIRAADLLIFNRTLTAYEALNFGLVNQVVDSENFQETFMVRLKSISEIPKQSLFCSRLLLRDKEKDILLEVNREEMRVLESRLKSGEFMESVMSFMNKKSKL